MWQTHIGLEDQAKRLPVSAVSVLGERRLVLEHATGRGSVMEVSR